MPVYNSKLDCPVVIPYYGGKYELSRKLVPMLPPHVRYFEPFFGGGSMFFRKSLASWNVLNDIDNDLINLYISIAEEYDKFIEYVSWLPRSRELHELYKKEFKKKPPYKIPDYKKAAHYFYIIRNSFNNVPLGTFSKDTYWGTSIIDELRLSKNKLNRATIENLDFVKLVERYSPIREKDLFYFDPPYVVAEKKKYYRNNFNYEKHNQLANVCNIINDGGGKFLISYDDKPEIRELYKDFYLSTVDTKYMGANSEHRGKVKSELVITNYKIKVQEELFS